MLVLFYSALCPFQDKKLVSKLYLVPSPPHPTTFVAIGALRFSNIVLDLESRSHCLQTNGRYCVVSLSMAPYPLLNPGSILEMSQHD